MQNDGCLHKHQLTFSAESWNVLLSLAVAKPLPLETKRIRWRVNKTCPKN